MTHFDPPRAERRPTTRTYHGLTLQDDYAWLKDPDWREVLREPAKLDPAIRAYLEGENAYAAHLLDPLAPLVETINAEMRGRIKENDSQVPRALGPYAYRIVWRDGGQHPNLARSARDGSADRIIIDGDTLAEGHAFYDFGDWSVSSDQRLIAWSVDDKGSEFYTIRIRDMESLIDREDQLIDTTGDSVWFKDQQHLLYVEMDEEHRPKRVKRHKLGTPQSEDSVVYEEADDGWFIALDKTQSGDFGLISVSDHETTEVYLVDLGDSSTTPRLIAARESGIRYEVEHHGDRLFIVTNADGAIDFKIVTAPLSNLARTHWQDLIPSRPGTMVLEQGVYARHLVRLERENALSRIVIRALDSGEEHAIAFQEEAYGLYFDKGFEFDTDRLVFIYSSMTTPHETYAYDMNTRTRALLKRTEIPSGHDPALYVTRRIEAISHDGTRVPVSLIHRRDLALDGSAPCLLYGYGSYGHSLSASFDQKRLSLVDRGFVFALAHIRGGTEKGWNWYVDGKREKKPNSFHDFIAAGHALIAAGYTAQGRIVAEGRSAGGMLMGAVTNMAPDLFAGILAEVPFVDVLNTMLDDTLPLTPPEWPEWGNPIESAEAYQRIAAYSPYDNIAARRYPAILSIGGLTDPRVTYWEPAKWIARLRAHASGGPFVLKTEMDAGHGGASGRFDRLKETALCFAFAVATIEGRFKEAARASDMT